MKALFITLATGLLFSQIASADALSSSDKAAMQSAMFQHIDRALVDGNYEDIDLLTGRVRYLVPARSHPAILQLGAQFVLCTNFVTKAGIPVKVDFYMERNGPSYKIFRTEIDNRGPLEVLVAAGKISTVD